MSPTNDGAARADIRTRAAELERLLQAAATRAARIEVGLGNVRAPAVLAGPPAPAVAPLLPRAPGEAPRLRNLGRSQVQQREARPLRLRIDPSLGEVTLPAAEAARGHAMYHFVISPAAADLVLLRPAIRRVGGQPMGHTSLASAVPRDADPAADAVLFAGNMRFGPDGRMVWWDNGSGHYAPHPGLARGIGLDIGRFRASHVRRLAALTLMRRRQIAHQALRRQGAEPTLARALFYLLVDWRQGVPPAAQVQAAARAALSTAALAQDCRHRGNAASDFPDADTAERACAAALADAADRVWAQLLVRADMPDELVRFSHPHLGDPARAEALGLARAYSARQGRGKKHHRGRAAV